MLANNQQPTAIVFASNNPHKLDEIRAILGDGYDVRGLAEIGCTDDIPEPYDTLEENAFAKARFVNTKFGLDCFADDTGLEVEALRGLPGVHSARFAGESKSSTDNIEKLLSMMQGITNRRAQFRTAIALILNGKEYLFEGIVKGQIAESTSGNSGFGYDPVFIPDGYDHSFAEMPETQKNSISHRFDAIRRMTEGMRG